MFRVPEGQAAVVTAPESVMPIAIRPPCKAAIAACFSALGDPRGVGLLEAAGKSSAGCLAEALCALPVRSLNRGRAVAAKMQTMAITTASSMVSSVDFKS